VINFSAKHWIYFATILIRGFSGGLKGKWLN